MFAKFPGNIYALSPSTVKEHQKLKKELDLDFPILSDEKLKTTIKAGMKNKSEHKPVRGFVIFDKDGNVIIANEVNAFGDEIEEIINYAAEKVAE